MSEIYIYTKYRFLLSISLYAWHCVNGLISFINPYIYHSKAAVLVLFFLLVREVKLRDFDYPAQSAELKRQSQILNCSDLVPDYMLLLAANLKSPSRPVSLVLAVMDVSKMEIHIPHNRRGQRFATDVLQEI